MDLCIDQTSGPVQLHSKGGLLTHLQTHLLEEDKRTVFQFSVKLKLEELLDGAVETEDWASIKNVLPVGPGWMDDEW